MRKLIYMIVKVLFFLLVGLIFCLLIYRLTSFYYERKFNNVEIGTHIWTVKKKWGNPDREFIYKDLNNCIVYKYKKDPLGWDTYIFIFNPKDSLLVNKNIDD